MGCSCGHCEEKEEKGNDLVVIAIGAIVFAVGLILEYLIETDERIIFCVFLAGYLFLGYGVIISAVRNALKKRFAEDFLMVVATICAFLVGAYSEAMGVMLFYRIGELIEDYAEERSRRSISELMDIRPDHAMLINTDGTKAEVESSFIGIGSNIFVGPGERVPLDGMIVNGTSSMDTKALTGESLPRDVTVGDTVLSGMINTYGTLIVRTEKDFADSTASRMIELIEEAESKKAKTEKFISRFAKLYTPPVIVLAILTFAIPVIFGGNADEWLYRAIIILVVSCPCALVISVPLAFYCGIGKASVNGLLIKGGNYVEMLARAETIVFDKTGTLTAGSLSVSDVEPVGMTSEDLLRIAATAEHSSRHPVAMALKAAVPDLIIPPEILTEEIAGCGVIVNVDGKEICVGNSKLMESKNILWKGTDKPGTVVYVSSAGVFAGYITLSDIIRDDSKAAISELKRVGVKKTVMLTGDTCEISQAVGKELGIDDVYSDLLPADKVSILERIIDEPGRTGSVAYVGDGINDAPVLARADIGIAMGGIGSDSAIESADVVIMTDEPSRLPQAIRMSKHTVSIAKENIILAVGIKFAALALVFLGLATMWHGVFADVGITAIVAANAMRAGRIPKMASPEKHCSECKCEHCPVQ